MPYAQLEVRSFRGLYLQQNSFQVPDGAMEIASRVVIRSDEVITKMAGFYEYWRPNGSETISDIRATYTFQGKTIGFFSDGIGYFEDSIGDLFNPVGTLTATLDDGSLSFLPGMDFSEQNKTLYFTAEQGVYKLEAYNGKTRKAGIPPGLGLLPMTTSTAVGYRASGILEPNTKTSYRALFGRRDGNKKLMIGTPSDVLTIGVPDTFVGVDYEIVSEILTIDIPTGFLSFDTNKGSLSALIENATDPTFNGEISIFYDYTTNKIYFPAFGSADATGTLDITFYYAPGLSAQIPSEISDLDDEYFVQFYRTSSSDSVDAEPEPDFKLATEKTLTASDITSGIVTFIDTVDSALLGPLLYTNPNTAEGPTRENSRPPKAKYLADFKGHTLYLNIRSVQRLLLDLVNSEEFIGNTIVFKSGVQEEAYKPINLTVNSNTSGVYFPGNFSATTDGPELSILIGSHTIPVGSTIKIFEVTGGTLPLGEYLVSSVTATRVKITTAHTATFVFAQIVADNVARLFNGFEAYRYNYTNIAEWTEFVAKNLVAAINSNPNSFMYANYASSSQDFPGKIAIQSKEFIDPIYVRYGSTPSVPIFIQNLPDSFLTGIQYYSEADELGHYLFPSKPYEPDAVPISGGLPVGSGSSEGSGIFPLRDCVIILKEDGIYKMVGDNFSDFTIIPMDTTVKFTDAMAQSASVINNTVIAFCNQGLVRITENSSPIISRRIEDVIQPLIGRDLSSTFLFGHEADRLFYIQTSGINPGEAPTTWVFNVLNETWTNTPDVYSNLALGPRSELFGIKEDSDLSANTLWRQRRTNTRIDYCGAFATANVLMDAANSKVCTLTITGGNIIVPEVGDIVVAQNIFNRIEAVTDNGSDYTLTFAQNSSMSTVTPTAVILYKAIESKAKMAPFHAGQVGRSKHFAQLQIHLRQQMITALQIEFAGAFYANSEQTNWKPLSLSSAGAQGWGISPWGLFPWGLVDGQNLVAGTEPASILRTWIPRLAARNTFIQPVLTHKQAGQSMMIQALSYSVHGYGERTSK